MMKRNDIATALLSLSLLLGILGGSAAVSFAAAPQSQPQPKYTVAEYNAYQAAAAEKNPQQKIKLLDDFVAKYPTSDLLSYAYPDYVVAYSALRQWPKVIEYFDKYLALSLDDAHRLTALYQRAATYELAYNPKDPGGVEQSGKARDLALEGLKRLESFKKPDQVSDEQWATLRKQYSVQLINTAGLASSNLKDYKAAAEYLHKSLEEDPKQPLITYKMGIADLQQNPPQFISGFWALARAIDLKMPDAEKVTKFLHDKISDYQQPGCESLVDTEIKELLVLAQNSTDPPSGYNIVSAADLGKVREQANIETVLADLKAGGDKGKITWLAVCSGEFPEALGKAYEVSAATPGAIVIKAGIGTKEEELNAGTAPNGDLKLAGQPEAARLEKDSIFRFKGKLTGYTPDPFYLTWEGVQVNPEDIPEEKGKKPAKRPGKAKP